MNLFSLLLLRKRWRRLRRSVRLLALSLVMALAVANTGHAFPIEWLSVPISFEPIEQSLFVTNGAIAQAIISGTAENPSIVGKLLFVETPEGLNISGSLFNIPPGAHGFHIHEGNSCADNGNAAGAHFNPVGVEHGHLLSHGFEHAHAGDLGNLMVADDGSAHVDQTIPGLTLGDDWYSVAGRSVILHAQPDDFGQPTGNAGARIACGVINIAVMP